MPRHLHWPHDTENSNYEIQINERTQDKYITDDEIENCFHSTVKKPHSKIFTEI